MNNSAHKVLVCTPSDYSADLICSRLISHFSPSQLLRLNSFSRHTAIPSNVQAYCTTDSSTGMFILPSLSELINYSIIITTTVVSGILFDIQFPTSHFTHLFVDECSQALEAELFIPFCLLSNTCKVILAGDHFQLGPVIHSEIAKQNHLACSIQERLMNLPLYKNSSYSSLLVNPLNMNYRAHPILLKFTSDMFYNSQLIAAADTETVNSLLSWHFLPNSSFPLLFHGCVGVDVYEQENHSFFNTTEAAQIAELIQDLLQQQIKTEENSLTSSPSSLPLCFPSDIVVISPYKLQIQKIRQLLRNRGLGSIRVNDIDEIQGQEYKIVFISPVISRLNTESSSNSLPLDLFRNSKRFNVALSRAIALCVIVGNPYSLQHEETWNKVLEYCVLNESYTGCQMPIKLKQLYINNKCLGGGELIQAENEQN
jgi:superfamily I DNA and/or RNA helicase